MSKHFRLFAVFSALILAIIFTAESVAQTDNRIIDSTGFPVWGQAAPLSGQIATAPIPTEDVAVPVVVRLEIPYTPEALLDAQAVQNQRQMIQQTQTDLVDGMDAGSITYWDAKTYTTLPYLAMSVSELDVNRMQNLQWVRSVAPDRLTTIQTTLANPVVGADTAQTEGFDGSGYAVAVLDTGVDFTHPALVNRRVGEACFTTDSNGQVVQGAGGTFSPVIPACPNGEITQIGDGAAAPFSPGDGPDDCNFCGHGTHVAGIAAGNDEDVFQGVAPGAGIIGINVFSIFTDEDFCESTAGEGAPCTLSFTSDQLRAFEHLLEQSETVDIASANLSLGGGLFGNEQVCDGNDTFGYRTVVDALRSANVAVIAAAGNDGSSFALSQPACFSNVISVGATSIAGSSPGINVTDAVASFSNSTAFMDFWAPGLVIESSEPGDVFVPRAGTSMAAPYIAGAWAVMRQAYPDESVTQIQQRLEASGVSVQDPRNGVTKPRLQLDTALPQSVPPVAPTITEQPQNITVTEPDAAVFTVAVSGTFTDVVWQRSVSGSGTFVDIPSANELSLTLSPTTTEDSGSQFRAVINNEGESVTSDPATLTVLPVCEGDVNGDGFVTPADAVFVANRVGQVDEALDLDESSMVDEDDVQFVLDRLGTVCEPAP